MLQIKTNLMQVRESDPGPYSQSPDDVAAQCDDMRTIAQETFVVITIDTRKRTIDRHMVSMGILDASLCHPREVFRPAIADGAQSIILVHNHPSGDPTPSAEDVKITRQFVESGRILEIPVLDHIIIGRPQNNLDSGFTSLRETGLVKFDD